MNSYLDWNDGVAQHFFRPEMAGHSVWLYVTDDLITQLGNRIGGGVAEFVDAVKAGPDWATARGLCQRALQTAEGWRDRELRYPPYIGFLGLFVLAAGLEGDFAPHAYYPRLRTLLGDASSDALPSFDRMLELWDDLERWSAHDRSGELGLFEARIVGGHIHVGLPIAQTILSEHERGALPQMFAEAGLDPTSPPPDDELARILRAQGGNVLRPRTRELVRTRRDPEGYAALIDTVAEELAGWDGRYDDELSAEGTPSRELRFGSLRLCLAFDRVSGRLSASLRCRVKTQFPDGGLVLKSLGLPPLRCFEAGVPGWSSRLVDADTHEVFDAAAVEWDEALSLNDERLGWRFGLPRRRVRALVQGVGEGLADLVEVGQIPRAQPVYILYQDVDWPRLAEWADHECRDFRTHPVREGMRPGWQLASCSEVTGDKRVRSTFPELALSERVRLILVGGVRRDRGPNFFPFALPSVLLEGGEGRETVVCNGRALVNAEVARSYALPEGLPRESRITLEAVRDGEVLKRVSIYVAGEFEWRHATPEQISNEWGDPSTETAGVAGALMIGDSVNASEFERPVMLTPGVERSAPRVLLIGRIPGQICSWPVEPHAADWRPVWAVPMGRRGRAVYCGSDLEAAAPALGKSGSDRHKVDLWKKTLWHRRKRIRAPEEPALAALWQSYVEAARRV